VLLNDIFMYVLLNDIFMYVSMQSKIF